MEFETKPWGFKKIYTRTPELLVAQLHVKEGGMCSKHYHYVKLNEFIVEEGHLQVSIDEGGPCILVNLYPGNRLLVRQLTTHQFKAVKPTVVWEIERAHGLGINDSDIKRLEGNLDFDINECLYYV